MPDPVSPNRNRGDIAAVAAFAVASLIIACGTGLYQVHLESRKSTELDLLYFVSAARGLARAASTIDFESDRLAVKRLDLLAGKMAHDLPDITSAVVVAETLNDPLAFRRKERYVVASDPDKSGVPLNPESYTDKRVHDFRTKVMYGIDDFGRQPGPAIIAASNDTGTITVVAARARASRKGFVSAHLNAKRGIEKKPVPYTALASAVACGVALFIAFGWTIPRARGASAFVLLLIVAAASWYAALNGYIAWSNRRAAVVSARIESAAHMVVGCLPGTERHLPGLAEDMATSANGELDPRLRVSAMNGAVRVSIHTPGMEEAGRSLGIGVAPFLLFGLLVYAWVVTGRAGRVFRTFAEHFSAYAYTAPAALGMMVLVLAPFAFGIMLSLFRHQGGGFTFVGVQNFTDILASRGRDVTDPLSFYFTLGVTVLWTAANVFLHVAVGLGLALVLKSRFLKMKAVYRVLLILPWAIPNYVTALIWKGMFNQQFGAVNALLADLGLTGPDGISWFGSFATAFTANLVTNVWLGFPFMMVVALGALQSIPADLYEAAQVDGAGPWTKFRRITLPLLKPALFPAVILGSIWTFNQFNIIYLVSGGEPSGATDILITEAYRWAFERGDRYGYAAAYSTIIFLILLGYTLITNRMTKAAASQAHA